MFPTIYRIPVGSESDNDEKSGAPAGSGDEASGRKGRGGRGNRGGKGGKGGKGGGSEGGARQKKTKQRKRGRTDGRSQDGIIAWGPTSRRVTTCSVDKWRNRDPILRQCFIAVSSTCDPSRSTEDTGTATDHLVEGGEALASRGETTW